MDLALLLDFLSLGFRLSGGAGRGNCTLLFKDAAGDLSIERSSCSWVMARQCCGASRAPPASVYQSTAEGFQQRLMKLAWGLNLRGVA